MEKEANTLRGTKFKVAINRKGGGASEGVAEGMDTCPKRLPAPIHRPLEQGWPGVSMGLKDALFFLLFADIIYEGDWK